MWQFCKWWHNFHFQVNYPFKENNEVFGRQNAPQVQKCIIGIGVCFCMAESKTGFKAQLRPAVRTQILTTGIIRANTKKNGTAHTCSWRARWMITAEHSGHRLFNAQPIFPSLLSSLEVNEVFGNVCAFAISDGSLCSLCFQTLTAISWFRPAANIIFSLSYLHTHRVKCPRQHGQKCTCRKGYRKERKGYIWGLGDGGEFVTWVILPS